MSLSMVSSRAGGFVKGRPRNDGWMVQVAQDNLSPFALLIVNRLDSPKVHSPVTEFSPRQVSQTVCPVVEAFLKHLLM